MTDMFKVSDPSAARGNSITAREILDKAAKQMDTSLAKDPVLRADMMSVIGEVSQNLGLFPQAHHLLENALQLQRRTLGAGVTGSHQVHEQHEPNSGRWKGTTLNRKNGREIRLELARRKLGAKDPTTLSALSNLAVALKFEGQYPEAEKTARDGFDMSREVLGDGRFANFAVHGYSRRYCQ